MPARNRPQRWRRSLLCGKPVPDSRLGEHVARPGGIGLQFPTELGSVDAEVVSLLRVVRTPDLIEQLMVRQELSGVPDQRRQQAILDGRQMDRLPRNGY